MKGKLLRESETPHYCDDCKKQLVAGDKITHTHDMTRMWHTACFEANLTPCKDWPKSART
jgi:hypothetical protein